MKFNTKQLLCLCLMGYLAVSVASQILQFFFNLISVAVYHYRFSAASGFTLFFTGLSLLALLVIVGVTAFEQFGKYKDTVKKFWFVPAVLRGIAVLISVISTFASTVGYSSGWLLAEGLLNNLIWFVVNVLQIAVLMLFLPKYLLESETEPIFRTKQPEKVSILQPGPYQQTPAPQPVYQTETYPQPAPQPAAYQPEAYPQPEAFSRYDGSGDPPQE